MMNMLAIHNPTDGCRIAELEADHERSLLAKAERARAAQPVWAATPLAERKACIERFRAAVMREREALAATLTRETGKPIRQARAELDGLLPRLDFFLAEVDGCVADETVYQQEGMTERIQHLALGVVANLSAWNYPWFVGCNVIVPALLTGNSVLYKPSEYATLTGLEIVRLLHEAGVSPNVLVPVVGGGPVGGLLLKQSLDGVFFTGSRVTGAHIAQALAGRFVKLQLEMGGKDPSYVCDDADAPSAARSLAEGAMYNSGQSCCAVERIYVHAAVHDEFLDAFLACVRAFKVGDPMDEDTYIGPLTRSGQLQVLQAQVADAQARGAVLHLGGERLPGPGNFYLPTVLSRCDHRMELMREESFGPVIGIQKVSGDDEAVRLMNETRYGLTAGVYTPSRARAERLLSQVHAGSVYWNCCDRVSPRLPWSGVRDSGLGLTLSRYGIQAFTRPKAWHLREG